MTMMAKIVRVITGPFEIVQSNESINNFHSTLSRISIPLRLFHAFFLKTRAVLMPQPLVRKRIFLGDTFWKEYETYSKGLWWNM